jgi:ribosome modulation factor
MNDQISTTNASWVDAWMDGYNEGRYASSPEKAPDHFTPAARVEWISGWKAGDLDRQVKELGYE